MSVGPDDLLAFAKELSERSDEVARRAAISRAYYAGFHAAVSVFGPPSVASSAHSAIIEEAEREVRLCFGAQRRHATELARALKRCRKHRRTADYNLEIKLSESDSKQALSLAQEAIIAAGLLAEFEWV